MIGNHTRWNGQEAHSAFISGSARAPLTLRLAARGTGLTVLWLTVAVYFKDFPLPSMTAQQRASLGAFGHLFNGETLAFNTENLQHQIEELLPASFLLLLRFTATQVATAPERHQVVGHQAQ